MVLVMMMMVTVMTVGPVVVLVVVILSPVDDSNQLPVAPSRYTLSAWHLADHLLAEGIDKV